MSFIFQNSHADAVTKKKIAIVVNDDKEEYRRKLEEVLPQLQGQVLRYFRCAPANGRQALLALPDLTSAEDVKQASLKRSCLYIQAQVCILILTFKILNVQLSPTYLFKVHILPVAVFFIHNCPRYKYRDKYIITWLICASYVKIPLDGVAEKQYLSSCPPCHWVNDNVTSWHVFYIITTNQGVTTNVHYKYNPGDMVPAPHRYHVYYYKVHYDNELDIFINKWVNNSYCRLHVATPQGRRAIALS